MKHANMEPAGLFQNINHESFCDKNELNIEIGSLLRSGKKFAIKFALPRHARDTLCIEHLRH